MFQWLILHSAVTAALAVVVLAAGRFFRLGPAARHLLWLIVLIKFLTPPVVYWPWALPMYGRAPAATATAWRAGSVSDPSSAQTLTGTPVAYAPGSPNIIETPPDIGPEPEIIEVPAVEERPAASPFSWNWLPTAFAWTWLAGSVLVAMRQAMRVYGWRRRLAKGRPASDDLKTLVRELAAGLGIQSPRLIVLVGAVSPMVWCFGASRLIWPAGLEERLSAPGCRAVLLHELAHLRRRDHWVGWLLLAGGCVWWWHPLFCFIRRRLGQEAELACDAWVVAAAPDARRAYAEALLEVSQRMAAAVAVPALGATGGRRDLERRLVMIMRGPASRRLSWVGLAGAIALGLLGLPAWTLGGDKTPLPTVSTPPPMATTSAPHTAFTEGPPAPPAAADPLLAPDAVPRTPPVATQPAAPGSNASKDPAVWQRDRKLKELEDKVQQLLKEMQQLRGQAPAGGVMQPGGLKEVKKAVPTPEEAMLHFFLMTPAPAAATPVPVQPSPAVRPEAGAEVITLTRVTYELKAATAEALATFLKENVKTAILEIKNEGDSLIVTTTPEAQHVIGQLINLIQGKKPDVTLHYRPAITTPERPAPQAAPPSGTSGPPWPGFIGPPVAK